MGENSNPISGTIEKQPHGGALFRPEKGITANRRGRPRKYVSKLREQGYSQSEVNDAILVLISMTEKEALGVFEHPDATMLEKTIVAALLKGMEQGSLFAIDTLLTRVYGKPKESMSVTGENNTPHITISLAG